MYFVEIEEAVDNKLKLKDGTTIEPNDYEKIYNGNNINTGFTEYIAYKNKGELIFLAGKYVAKEIKGGRSSRKKINKSSKRRKSSNRARTNRNRRQRN